MRGVDWLILAMCAFHLALGIGAWLDTSDEGEGSDDVR